MTMRGEHREIDACLFNIDDLVWLFTLMSIFISRSMINFTKAFNMIDLCLSG